MNDVVDYKSPHFNICSLCRSYFAFFKFEIFELNSLKMIDFWFYIMTCIELYECAGKSASLFYAQLR